MARREQLLDGAVGYVVAHGIHELSFRTLATELGVAHNSIRHHFGTRSELIRDIYTRLRELAQGAVAGLAWEEDPVASLQQYWREATTPGLEQMWTSFFEFYAQALRDPDSHSAYLGEVTQAWVAEFTARGQAAGLDRDRAEAVATLLIGAIRGLLLDRIGGSDPARPDAAFALLTELIAPLVQQRGEGEAAR